MRLMTIEEAGQRLAISPRSLADRRFRERIGLPGVRVGRRIGFEEGDIEALITRNREPMAHDGRAPVGAVTEAE